MTVESWDALDPLAQVEGETPKANLALRDYALLGGGRSLRSLQKEYQARAERGERPPTVRMATLEEWSSKNRWQARVADFERGQHLARLVERRERQQDWDNRAWSTANALLEKAEQMLKYPLVRTETIDGKTTVSPARWSLDTLTRLVNTADKLARLAVQLPDDQARPVEDWTRGLPEHVPADEVDVILDAIAAQVVTGLETLNDELKGPETDDAEPD